MSQGARMLVAVMTVVASLSAVALSPTGGADAVPAAPLVPAELGWLVDERVLVVGDSLLADTEDALDARLDALGVDHEIVAVPGSGFGEQFQGIDWLADTDRLLDEHRPTVIVAAFCCNFRRPFPHQPDGDLILPGTPAFRDYWGGRARIFAKRMTAGGAELWWTVTPPSESEMLTNSVIDPINDTTLSRARHPGPGEPDLRLIRWDLALTGGTGVYDDTVTEDGAPTRVRRDGLHLTEAGGTIAADAILSAFAGADPGLAWPAESHGPTPTQFAMARFLGLDPGNDLARAGLEAAYRAGETDLVHHIDALLHRPAWAGHVARVTALAWVTQHRLPRVNQLRHWVAELRSGTSLRSVADAFTGTAQFRRRTRGRTDAVLVDRAYRSSLGRSPTPDERSDWTVWLARRDSVTDLVMALATSDELARRLAARTEWLTVTAGLLGAARGRPPGLGATPTPQPFRTAQVLSSDAFARVAERFDPFPGSADPG